MVMPNYGVTQSLAVVEEDDRMVKRHTVDRRLLSFRVCVANDFISAMESILFLLGWSFVLIVMIVSVFFLWVVWRAYKYMKDEQDVDLALRVVGSLANGSALSTHKV